MLESSKTKALLPQKMGINVAARTKDGGHRNATFAAETCVQLPHNQDTVILSLENSRSGINAEEQTLVNVSIAWSTAGKSSLEEGPKALLLPSIRGLPGRKLGDKRRNPRTWTWSHSRPEPAAS